jgi:hypothetical protein
MLHAREDYNRIQDPENKIGQDEPVFLIRAQDEAGPTAVREWAYEALKRGASVEIVKTALDHAKKMERWQSLNISKVPDMP